MSSIELVVTDLDGTLWEDPGTIPTRTLDAIAEIERRGIPVLVATGRRMASARAPLAAVGLAPPAVLLNGGLGVDLSTSERFHTAHFPANEAVEVLAVFANQSVDPCIYVDDDQRSVFVSNAPSTHPDHLATFGDDVATSVLAEVVAGGAVLGFSVLGIPEGIARHLGAELATVATSHVAPDRQYEGFAVTVAPERRSKWDGIVSFCGHRRLDEQAVLVMGDGPNDVEMLSHAAIAVVPADGHDDALALADHTIGRALDGGWAEVLDLL